MEEFQIEQHQRIPLFCSSTETFKLGYHQKAELVLFIEGIYIGVSNEFKCHKDTRPHLKAGVCFALLEAFKIEEQLT